MVSTVSDELARVRQKLEACEEDFQQRLAAMEQRLAAMEQEKLLLMQQAQGTGGDLWERVLELRKENRPVTKEDRKTGRRTGEMADLLFNLYKEDLWRPGSMPDRADRTKALGDLPSIGYLGKMFKWVGRNGAVEHTHKGMLLIREHMDLTVPPDDDRVKEGIYRQAIVAAPGTGKTAFSEVLCQLVAEQPARTRNEKKLQQLLKSCISRKLQYRMDMGKDGNGRLHEEDGMKIAANQSLALRLLYMFCGGVLTFRQFMNNLIAEARSKLEIVATVLAQLEGRDVISAACTALKVTDTTAFHFILDECHSGFELNPQAHQHPDSTVAWFKQVMSSHAFNVLRQQHLVLLTLVGTHMDIASVGHLSTSGTSLTYHIPLPLLAHTESLEILEDLCIRLGLPWCRTDSISLLAKFGGGGVRQLECLLAAAASVQEGTEQLTREEVSVSGLKAVFDHHFRLDPVMWERALVYLEKRTRITESTRRWQVFQGGELAKTILGKAMTGETVLRGDFILQADRQTAGGSAPPVPAPAAAGSCAGGSSAAGTGPAIVTGCELPTLTFGNADGCGVLSLDPVEGKGEGGQAAEIMARTIDTEEFYVRQLPMVFWRWFKAAEQEEWFTGPAGTALSPVMQKLDPMMKEVVDVTCIVWKMLAFKKLLGRTTCRLGELLPCDKDELTAYRDIEIKLAEKGYWNIRQFRERATTKKFKKHYLPPALEGQDQCYVYWGMGKDPAPDWFIILFTVTGDIVIIQGQSKCHDKDCVVETGDLVEEEYAKRLMGFNKNGKRKKGAKVIPVFAFATDATVQRGKKRQRGDVVIIDRPKRIRHYNPFGAVAHESYQVLRMAGV